MRDPNIISRTIIYLKERPCSCKTNNYSLDLDVREQKIIIHCLTCKEDTFSSDWDHLKVSLNLPEPDGEFIEDLLL